MRFKDLLWKAVNSPLRRLGCELRQWPAERGVFTMNEALRRARQRGLHVQTVIDVGASNGCWSSVAMRHFPDAHYLLFEPLEERAADLQAFKAAHPNVEHVATAAGDEGGEISFSVAPDLDGSSIAKGPSSRARTVPVTTIDAEVAERRLAGPFLLKLDTHGFEVSILKGAAETLKEASLLVIEAYNFELAPSSLRFPELCMHLEQLGFRCADLADPLLRARDHLLWQIDLVFLRKDAPHFAHASFA